MCWTDAWMAVLQFCIRFSVLYVRPVFQETKLQGFDFTTVFKRSYLRCLLLANLTASATLVLRISNISDVINSAFLSIKRVSIGHYLLCPTAYFVGLHLNFHSWRLYRTTLVCILCTNVCIFTVNFTFLRLVPTTCSLAALLLCFTTDCCFFSNWYFFSKALWQKVSIVLFAAGRFKLCNIINGAADWSVTSWLLLKTDHHSTILVALIQTNIRCIRAV